MSPGLRRRNDGSSSAGRRDEPPNTSITAEVHISDTTSFGGTPPPYTFNPTASGTTYTANLQAAPGPVPSGSYMEVIFHLSTSDKLLRPTLDSGELYRQAARPARSSKRYKRRMGKDEQAALERQLQQISPKRRLEA